MLLGVLQVVDGQERFAHAYVNAVTIAKRWRRPHAPGWMPPKPARPGAGRHTLSSYMKKMGYEVPPILGPNNTGQRLRYVARCWPITVPTCR